VSLFERDAFEAFVTALPATEIVYQWGDASVGKVGGKIFAILSGGETTPLISFKCSDMGSELLPDLDGVSPAPYLARAKWVAVKPDAALTSEELAAYLAEAHVLIAGKLTAQQKSALGLTDYLATR
jgi:predicted DNA-binding protein (MmcQ/YjbR family)